MSGITLPEQYPSETGETPEPTCKFCGGFLTLYKCQNWFLDLFGKESRVKASGAWRSGFQFCDLDSKEPIYIDGREASRVELQEFLDSCFKHKRPCKLYDKEFRASDESIFCEECDELLALESITNPCPDCLKNEPDTILKRFDQTDKDALKVTLDFPPSIEDRTFIEDAGLSVGKKWQGYQLEIFGIVVGKYSDIRFTDVDLEFYEKTGIMTKTPDGHIIHNTGLLFPFTCIPSEEEPDLIIRLCRMRARYKKSSLYAEMRRHPYSVRRVAVHGLEYKHTKKDLDMVIKGLPLLRKANKNLSGRPPGTTKYTKQRFRRVSVAKYKELLDEYSKDGRLPTIDDLAFTMNLHRATLMRYGNDYNFSIEQIRDEAITSQ